MAGGAKETAFLLTRPELICGLWQAMTYKNCPKVEALRRVSSHPRELTKPKELITLDSQLQVPTLVL